MSRQSPGSGGSQPPRRNWGEVKLRFGGRELLDLGIAWLALSLAFAIFFAGGGLRFLGGDPLRLLAVSAFSAGIGFLLHELAHKVASVYFDTPAVFKADYGMLGIAVVSALAGFLFAAPGAVYHPPTANDRHQGLIALAGPVTNVVLVLLFLPLYLVGGGIVGEVGTYGVLVNLLLAAFNMLPFGPLDGKKVLSWSKVAFVVAFLGTVGPAVLVLFGLFAL